MFVVVVGRAVLRNEGGGGGEGVRVEKSDGDRTKQTCRAPRASVKRDARERLSSTRRRRRRRRLTTRNQLSVYCRARAAKQQQQQQRQQ